MWSVSLNHVDKKESQNQSIKIVEKCQKGKEELDY